MVKDKKSESDDSNLSININPEITPILYTDNIHITVNEDGVVLDVTQRVGSSNQARVVTRIGMSRRHAKRFVTELGKLIIATENRRPTPKGKNVN